MPSFADSAVIFVLALMLFGPKKLPQLARQIGKLMAEFRRASNEFRMQMEDELRIEEQKEHQKKVDAMAGPPSDLPDPEHPHLPAPVAEGTETAGEADPGSLHDGTAPIAEASPVAPIAESGDLRMMPPSTGLPVQNSSHGNGFAYHEAPTQHDPERNPDHAYSISHEPEMAQPAVGVSSEEPAAETSRAEEQTHA